MNEISLNLKLLHGSPIEIENVGYLYPAKLSDIEKITIEKYNTYLNILCIDKEDIKKILHLKEDFEIFEFIYINCLQSEEYLNIVIEALEFFFKETVSFDLYKFYLGNIEEKRFIIKENFEEIRDFVKKMNCLKSKREEEDDGYRPVNEKARKILEKIRKDRETRKQIKRKENQGESLDLFNLISILSAYGNGINIFNVWDLTFFQFDNQFNRLRILKDYELNIQILLNTTEPSKVKFQHWLSKIVKE